MDRDTPERTVKSESLPQEDDKVDVASPTEVTEEKKELANDDNEPADAASEEENKEEVKPAEKNME